MCVASCRERYGGESGRGGLGCLFRYSLHKGLFLTFVVSMRFGIIVQVSLRIFGVDRVFGESFAEQHGWWGMGWSSQLTLSHYSVLA